MDQPERLPDRGSRAGDKPQAAGAPRRPERSGHDQRDPVPGGEGIVGQNELKLESICNQRYYIAMRRRSLPTLGFRGKLVSCHPDKKIFTMLLNTSRSYKLPSAFGHKVFRQ